MFKQKFYLVIFGVYLLFSTALMATGVWPSFVVYLNLGLMLAAVILFDSEYALYSVILSLPFYVDIPAPKYDTVSAWRIVFLFIFIVFAIRNRGKVLNFFSGMFRRKSDAVGEARGEKIKFFPWDKYLLGFALAALLSLSVAKFKFAGLKELLFAVNIYLIYIVAVNVIRSREQILRGIAVVFSSLAAIVLLGFVQFAFSIFTNFFYFWQYWAIMIARLYYGSFFADTSLYSNSWIAFSPTGQQSLRMFSVLPDSHSFAVLAMFSIPYAIALLYFAKQKWQKILLWIFIILAVWAIILSGTRGVWVGLAAPAILAVIFYFSRFVRRSGTGTKKLLGKIALPILFFLIILAASPLIQKAIFSGRNYGNYIQRARSVYNLDDESNALRISIWKKTAVFIARHPLLGAGYGNFITTLGNSGKSYSGAAQKRSQAFNLPQKYISAHNLYLQVLAETGILGFVFFTWFLIKMFWWFWKHFRNFASREAENFDGYAPFAIGVGLYFTALFAYMLVDTTLMNDRVLIYFFLSLALAAASQEFAAS